MRVPEVYRDYSTARCITFEAPASPGPLTPKQYRVVSEALIRLTIEEGIFLADVAPERFVTTGEEIWLQDPTEAFTLDPERLRGISEVLSATRRGDVDDVTFALSRAGANIPKEPSALRRELRETMGSLGGPLWKEHALREIRNRSLDSLRRGNSSLQDEISQMLSSLVAAEELGRHTDATSTGKIYVGTVAAAEAAERSISNYRDPSYVVSRTVRKLAQPDTYADYPRQIHALLNELKDGEVEVRFRHEGLDQLISKVDILANRLVFALLIAALIVGSSMLGIFSEAGVRILGVSVLGLIGFVFAAILGLALLIDIIRSGRL